jgi:two-component system response regulator FixJ
VCIVDDDPSVCRALRRLVESAGFSVETFPSGGHALSVGLLKRAACVIIDIHLGDMTGFQLQRLLAAEGAKVPAIFITAHDDVPTSEYARRAGVAYLPKPIDGDVLLDTIHRAVRGK